MPISVPAQARKVLAPLAREAARRGLPLYAVGGCVRDWLLGRGTRDFDLVCEGDPAPLAEFCARLLGGRAQAFGQFGTLRVVDGGVRVDFSTSRKETYAAPAALPEVSPAPIVEDLFRRDFTVNAMALQLPARGAGELLDPVGGLKDLKARVIRLLHPRSLQDDPTRVFRAARYACRFGFKPSADFAELARAALAEGHAAKLSRHRLLQELWRVLGEKEPSCALKSLKRWGYLALIHPAIALPKPGLAEPEARLASLALSLGPRAGLDFLRSLPVERRAAAPVEEALALAASRISPRAAPSPAASAALRAHMKLPPAALKPLFLGGADLKAAGLPPGKEYHKILDEAGALQWGGKLRTRGEALKWLSRRLA